MDVLCRNETFWESDKIWNADRPHFSSCFRNLVLICVPCLSLWIVALAYFPWIVCRKMCRTTKPGCLFWAKQVSASILLVLGAVSVLLAIKVKAMSSGDTSLAPLLAPCVRSATVVLVLALVAVERRRGVASSTILFFYWMFVVVADIIPVYSFIVEEQDAEDRLVKSAVVYFTFALEILQLILHSFSDSSVINDEQQDYELEKVASFPSWLTYCWMNRLMSRGYKDELHDDDVPPLNSRDRMLNAGKVLCRNKVFRHPKSGRIAERNADGDNDNKPMQTQNNNQAKNKKKKSRTRRSGVVAVDEKTPLLSAHWTRSTSSRNNNNNNQHQHDDLMSCNADDDDDDDHRSWAFRMPSSASSSTDDFERTIIRDRPLGEGGGGGLLGDNNGSCEIVGGRGGGGRQKGEGGSEKGWGGGGSGGRWNGGRRRRIESGGGKGGDSRRSELALGWTLLKTFLWPGVVSNVPKIPHDLLMLVNPLLLGELILFCDDVTVPEWRGYVTGAALCVSLLLQAVFFHLTFHLSMALGIRAKAALTAAIFRKVLTVASKGRRDSPEGEIINLISVDTQHVNKFLSFLPYAWSGLLQLALSVYFLYRTIGMATFAGAGLLLVLLALNAWFMTKLGSLQTSFMEHKDSRLKMVTEILAAIKTVKVYAWERVLGSRVSRARERELHVLQRVALLDASQTILWTLAPFVMSLLTFTTRVFSDVTDGLTSREVFVTLSYLNVMRNAVTVAPMVITDIVQAAVSLRRLERFLNHDDLDPNNVSKNPTQEAVVSVQSATCSWEKDSTLCLKGLSLQVKEGSLVAVVGPMGSGKSSLLAAILGELHVHSGVISVNTAVSYVPQTPWLRPGTVKAHVVGQDFRQQHHHEPIDQTRYDAATAVCALKSDFAAWPSGDLTEIGEKGATLSGGQRQRISLARAVYESRDLYLMDDPISAVDNRVGRQIFRDLIGQKGLLRDATRIVTTSTYHWLPHADVIVVMSEGEIAEIGDYHDLVSKRGNFTKLLSSNENQKMAAETTKVSTTTKRDNYQGITAAKASTTRTGSTGTAAAKSEKLKRMKTVDRTDLSDWKQAETERSGKYLAVGKSSQQKTTGNALGDRRKLQTQAVYQSCSSVQDSQAKLLANLNRHLECAGPGAEISPEVKKREHLDASCLASDESATNRSQNVTGASFTASQEGEEEEASYSFADGAPVHALKANGGSDKKDALLITARSGERCRKADEGSRRAARASATSGHPLASGQSFRKETEQAQRASAADSSRDTGGAGDRDDVAIGSDLTNVATRTEHRATLAIGQGLASRTAASDELEDDDNNDEGDDDDRYDADRDDNDDDFGDKDRLNVVKAARLSVSAADAEDSSSSSTDSRSDRSQGSSTSTLTNGSRSPDCSDEEGEFTNSQTLADRGSCDDADADDEYADAHDGDNKRCRKRLMSTLREHSEGSLGALEATTTVSCRWREELLSTSVSCELLVRGRQHHTLVDEEHADTGKVNWRVYAAIARALGRISFTVMTACYVLFNVTSVAANYWLSYWTDQLRSDNVTSLVPYGPDIPGKVTGSLAPQGPDVPSNSTSVTPRSADPDVVRRSNDFYLGVFGAFGAGQCIFVVTYALLLAFRRVRASREMHATLLRSVLSSPLTFFHRNPAARVLNRMSRDLEVFDSELWWSMEVVLDSLCHVISTCVVVTLGSPYYLVAVLPVAAAYYFIQRYYIGTSRKLRRLESTSRSFVFTQLSQLLEGGMVLRAMGTQATERAYETSAALVDSSFKFTFAYNTAGRWLGVRVGAIGVVTVGVATILGVAFRNTTSGGIIGLAITYALDVTESLNWLVRMAGDLETNAVSVERILEYSSLTPEDADTFPTVTPSADWPSAGRIQFMKLSARYWPQHTRVLRCISCDVRPGEKVGVVGRTGAGKTSLWGVLLGLLTSSEGAVLIDDVDTRCVSLQELRSRIAVMPQEPMILDGSIRLNLDPKGVASDSQMWAALERTQLANYVRSLSGGLDYHCQPDGQGFSSGQRQLLCLARVLLRQCRVIVLDEATSSVDPETENIICRTIQDACAGCTVLIISHRLHTVMHCDRVMVLDGGILAEMNSPSKLLKDPFSLFSRLASSCDMTQ